LFVLTKKISLFQFLLFINQYQNKVSQYILALYSMINLVGSFKLTFVVQLSESYGMLLKF